MCVAKRWGIFDLFFIFARLKDLLLKEILNIERERKTVKRKFIYSLVGVRKEKFAAVRYYFNLI